MNKRIIILIVVLGFVTVASLAGGIYFFLQYQAITKDSSKVEDMQSQKMLSTIASVMELPQEKPSIVTITDREKLQSQEFFRKAANGDKIIIYESAKRVILYRPSTGKVIDVAPLVFNTPETGGVTPLESLPSEKPSGRVRLSDTIVQQATPSMTPSSTSAPSSTDSAIPIP